MGDETTHVVFDSAQLAIQALVAELRQQAVQSVVHVLFPTHRTSSIYAPSLQTPQTLRAFACGPNLQPADEGFPGRARISP